ncbi:hypothetical protein [Haloplasma contractile]|uniref:Uncharacterized protein n=1 Tax=Haloplasma contractile SSD-17B TaxID=1033810 RepID=U2DV82_9MOLU|nr:hypothetical protein [Haloplasma contractile]ERJ12302.1 hypothetical protein HLPCO_001829 [Haloplasma contractile SSD-17B]
MIVKIRYRNLGNKDNFMQDYMSYIENGGKLTLDNKGMLAENPIDNPKFKETYSNVHNAGESPDDFIQNYSDYIEHRDGSEVLFSGTGIDVESVKQSFKYKKSGVIYYPIISITEDESLEYGFSREVMIEKAKIIATMFKEELNISDYDFEWLCAYHEKPEEDQVEEAGLMPHLHFIIYSGTQRDGYNTKAVINNIRKKAISIFYSEYRKEILKMREEKINEIKLFKSDTQFHEELKSHLDILYTTLLQVNKGIGKVQYQALVSNQNILVQIKERLENEDSLSHNQLKFLQKNKIDLSVKKITDLLENYDSLLAQVSFIIDDIILKSQPYKDKYDEYIELSRDLRKVHHENRSELYESMIEQDKQKIFDKLKNSVIRVSLEKYLESKSRYSIQKKNFLNTMFNGTPLLKLNTRNSTDVCKKIANVLFFLQYSDDEILKTLDEFIEKKQHSKYVRQELVTHIKKLNIKKSELKNQGLEFTVKIDEIKDLSSILDKSIINAHHSFIYHNKNLFLENRVKEVRESISKDFSTSSNALLIPVRSEHWDLIEAQKDRDNMTEEERKEKYIKNLLSKGIDIRI